MFSGDGCLNLHADLPLLRSRLKSAMIRNSFLRMKRFSAVWTATAVIFVSAVNLHPVIARADGDQIAVSVGRLLEEGRGRGGPALAGPDRKRAFAGKIERAPNRAGAAIDHASIRPDLEEHPRTRQERATQALSRFARANLRSALGISQQS